MKRFVIAVLLSLVAVFTAPGAEPSPRTISPAERRAVEVAADFLDRGPAAFLENLASSSPWKSLAPEVALAEIEVRTGPERGAEWQLLTAVPSLGDRSAMFAIAFPSGADDTLIVNLVQEGSEWNIVDLEISAEAVPPLGDDLVMAKTATTEPVESARGLVLFAGILASLLAAVGIVFSQSRRAVARVALAASLACGLAAVAARWMDSGAADAGRASLLPPTSTGTDAPLGTALEVRRALARGRVMPSFGALQGAALDAAVLWKAQDALQKHDLDSVTRVLDTFPPPSPIPLAEILRGRVAFLQSREVDAARAYERAVNLGPGRDALWQEAGTALSILGFEERGARFLDRLGKLGSRDASGYYVLAMLAASERNNERAVSELRKAWQLQPLERKDLLDLGILWEAISGPELASAVRLNDAAEPVLTPSIHEFDPIRVPISGKAFATGDYLWIEIGEQRLIVPGGSRIRPEGTTFTDARTLRLRKEERALEQLPDTVHAASEPGALAQPLLRRRIEETAEALASRNRWGEIEELTRGLRPDSDHVPYELLLQRGTALRRLRRPAEANELLVAVAAFQSKKRKTDVKALIELGQILASIGMHDAAIRLLERAGSIRQLDGLDERIRQIQLDRELATRYKVHHTDHFELRYPPDAHSGQVVRIGEILEAELRRIAARLGTRELAKVTVNLLRWQEFSRVYSSHLLGFYDGRITLPLIGVPEMIPDVVAVLSHELTHAVVAQMTNDQAPRWFQEGLATRMEMRKYSRNALNMYDADRLLSIAMLDSVLSSSPDPSMISAGYIEAHTLIRFVENRFGADSVNRMVAAFAAGASTESAVENISARSLVEFDLAFREWGNETRVFADPDPIRYDETSTEGIWMNRKSGSRGRP